MVARMRVAAACIGAVAVLSSPGCQNPAGPGQGRAAQGNSKAANGGGSGDAALIDAPAIEASTYVAAARLHETQGRLFEAVQQYQYALKENPKNIELLGRIGVLYDRLGNGAMAEKAFLEAIRIAPNDARMHNNLAFSYILRNKWKDAEVELTRALELAPQFARARVNLGMVLGHEGQFDEAFKQFETALPPADAWYNLGLMYQSKRKTVEAAWAYKRALDLNPKLVAAKEQLSRLPSATLGAADEMLKQERAKTAAAEVKSPQTAPAEACALTGAVTSARPAVEASGDEPCEEPVEEAGERVSAWLHSLDERMPAFARISLGDGPTVQLGADAARPSAPRVCDPTIESREVSEEEMMSELDSLLAAWERNPELIHDYFEQAPWLTDGRFDRFDFEYSPSVFSGLDVDSAVSSILPESSTRPE